MTDLEEKEYSFLIDKREKGILISKEYKRYVKFVNQAFQEGLPKIAKVWAEGFNLQ